MSPSGFVHLHVASGYSLQYGASHPHVLVERAADQEMDTLALTDRNGTYGAVKFARACERAGIRPVLGVDLACRPTGLLTAEAASPSRRTRPRTPLRGGAYREAPGQSAPRVTLLAHAGGPGGGRAGWAALCRAVSAVQLAGERGDPVATLDLLAPYVSSGSLMVLLGPGSELGAAVARRRDDLAVAVLDGWRTITPAENLLVELVSHRVADGPGSTPVAARMAAVARRAGVASVLTNAVRYADRSDAPTVDVLDAARRLVPLDRRHLDRGNAEGFMKSGKEMAEIAEEIARLSGVGESAREARRLLARTRAVADRCALDPRADLGLGEVHFPEFAVEPAPGRSRSETADAVLRSRCEAGIGRRYGAAPRQVIWKRLDDELAIIAGLGYASYFLTVGDITDLIRDLGIRCAARGSGAGSLVNYLIGVSGVDPIRHGLLMERFLSPLRAALPDIDIDVESARRLEVYEAILNRYTGERCVTVSMMDTYRVRHAVRDVGAALGMPPGEVDAIAKAFPHIRARDARMAIRDLPELRSIGLLDPHRETAFDRFFGLVERLDGLPRHIAMHPCGVLLSDAALLDRTPVEASYAGYPMSQFDKDDVEDLGLLKLDVLGIRMQSAMAHAVTEISRVDGVEIDLDDQRQVPFEDPTTYAMISEAKTLGVFQIESPGQRELVGKSGIESFSDIITDISLFRPGPVKSDMITPYLEAKQGWTQARYLHEDLRPILGQTQGVVVFHEQVIEMIALFAGVTNAEGDEKRRMLGDTEGMAEVRTWFFPRALGRGYPLGVVEKVWKVIEAFASFGFCKAHAAAFALPTFQSAWLKAHWPAHFLSGVLTHDPGMYPKRLLLDDARHCGVAILGLDVDHSQAAYVVERVEDGYGIRLALAEVKGINEAEVGRIVAGAPYQSLSDFWQRAQVSRPIAERLVLAGGFDGIYRIGEAAGDIHRRGRVTRRDLLLQVAELDRQARAVARGTRPATSARPRSIAPTLPDASPDAPDLASGVWGRAAAQSRATPPPPPVTSVQLTLDLGDAPTDGEISGLPELTPQERMRAELEILGLDVSRHVIDSYAGFLADLGAVRSRDLLRQRSRSHLVVAGVKVATQTPPIRSGRRVVFLTVDDGTGPIDATFFEDAQGPYAATVFGSWLLVVRGVLRRTGRRGVSLRATGAWELPVLAGLWESQGVGAVHDRMAQRPEGFADPQGGHRRVLTHSSGFQMSPYADIRPAGESAAFTAGLSRSLWHRSPGSPG